MSDRDDLNVVLDTLEALLVKAETHFGAPMVNDVPPRVLALLDERRGRLSD